MSIDNNNKIDYIEVKVYDSVDGEKEGLLSNFDKGKNTLQLIVDGKNTTEVFSLAFYSITSITVLVKRYQEEVEEHYIFKKYDSDQLLAKKTIKAALQRLEIEKKANSLGYVNKNAYSNVPKKYVVGKKTTNFNVAKTSTVCGKSTSVNKSIEKKDSIDMYPPNNYYNNRTKKSISFIPRTSDFPTKVDLTLMRKMVKQVVTEVYEQKFTDFDKLSEDTVTDTITEKDIAQAMKRTHNHLTCGYNRDDIDPYGVDFRGY